MHLDKARRNEHAELPAFDVLAQIRQLGQLGQLVAAVSRSLTACRELEREASKQVAAGPTQLDSGALLAALAAELRPGMTVWVSNSPTVVEGEDLPPRGVARIVHLHPGGKWAQIAWSARADGEERLEILPVDRLAPALIHPMRVSAPLSPSMMAREATSSAPMYP